MWINVIESKKQQQPNEICAHQLIYILILKNVYVYVTALS